MNPTTVNIIVAVAGGPVLLLGAAGLLAGLLRQGRPRQRWWLVGCAVIWFAGALAHLLALLAASSAAGFALLWAAANGSAMHFVRAPGRGIAVSAICAAAMISAVGAALAWPLAPGRWETTVVIALWFTMPASLLGFGYSLWVFGNLLSHTGRKQSARERIGPST